jgi:hypothetical protein
MIAKITDSDIWEKKWVRKAAITPMFIYSRTEMGPAMKTFHVVLVGDEPAHDRRTLLSAH